MYQVLARKYRPKNFHELVGQSHVSTALTNAIDHQRLHHAYLFTGTRGVGKTTIARILAKCLNCETGVTSEPCGVCPTCVAIDSGRFIDLIEIDAASRTKVEDTRELLDNVPYAPTQGRYKVYLIDEVHMLSTHSFNALLKTLEEPPEHVKFLLATTDPQKLPITIISRCLQFVLRPIAQNILAEYLAWVLQKEQIPATPDALWQLASSAKGSVRDALSLTDQAIAFGNGQIADTTVEHMLGLIDQADVAQLLHAISNQDTAQVAQMISQLREQVVDAKAVFDSLVEILHEVALLQILPSFTLPLNHQQQQARQQLASQLSADTVQLYYEILVQSREKIALANTPLQALEMAILRLLAFRPLALTQRPQMVQSLAHPISEAPLLHSSPSNPSPIAQPTQQANSPMTEPTIPVQIDDTNPIDRLLDNANHLENLLTIEQEQIAQEQIAQGQIEQGQIEQGQQEDSAQLLVAPNFSPQTVLDNHNPNQNDLQETIPADDSPLALLIPAPQTLEGQWTPEKWDYWVYQAREQGWLMHDELVLAKRGYMTGDIGGKSEFLTSEQILSNSNTFIDFQRQLAVHFPQMQVTLTPINANDNRVFAQLPEQQQAKREAEALSFATQKLSQTPVIQALLQENARLDYVRLAK